MMSRITPRAMTPIGLVVSIVACSDRGPIGYGDGNNAGHTASASGGSLGKAGSPNGGTPHLSSSSAMVVGGGVTSTAGEVGGKTSGTGSNTATSIGGNSSTMTGSGGSANGTTNSPSGASSLGGNNARGGSNVVGGANASGGSIAKGGTSSGGSTAKAGAPGGGSSSAAGGSAGSPSLTAGAAGTGTNQMVLDPSSLYFFNLPINSVRWGIAGYVPNLRTCVSVIWDYSNTGHTDGAHCDEFGQMFPYVTMTANTDGPCRDWTYGGTVQVDNWTGCVDFKTYQGMNFVNSIVSVTSDQFTGQIVLDNRSLLSQPVVVMGLRVDAAASKSVYVQQTAGQQIPAWITATKDGAAVTLFDRCDIPPCSGTGPNCTASTHVATGVVARSGANSVAVTWDGHIRRLDSANNCLITEPAAAGTYRAQFCYGNSTTSTAIGSSDVVDPQCVTRDFTYPTEQVFVTVNGS